MLISASALQHHFRTAQAEPLSTATLLCKKKDQIYFLTKVHKATEEGVEASGGLRTEREQRMGSIKMSKLCSLVCKFKEAKWEDVQAGKSMKLNVAMCPRNKNRRMQANLQGRNLAQQMENFLNLLSYSHISIWLKKRRKEKKKESIRKLL